jgi:hypothetical protein
MNRKVIQKIIDELGKESPRLDYIRGVLETLFESLPSDVNKDVDKSLDKIFNSVVTAVPAIGEGTILDKEAAARLSNIKDIAR